MHTIRCGAARREELADVVQYFSTSRCVKESGNFKQISFLRAFDVRSRNTETVKSPVQMFVCQHEVLLPFLCASNCSIVITFESSHERDKAII